jgi:NAD-dependent SIR2 family protein deacetylase
MSITDNHFYALQSPIKDPNNNNRYFFFLVPVRIVMQCLEEGKEYTRAKCNGSSLNIVVYFNEKPPEKFKKIFDRNLEATQSQIIFNTNSLEITHTKQINDLID